MNQLIVSTRFRAAVIIPALVSEGLSAWPIEERLQALIRFFPTQNHTS